MFNFYLIFWLWMPWNVKLFVMVLALLKGGRGRWEFVKYVYEYFCKSVLFLAVIWNFETFVRYFFLSFFPFIFSNGWVFVNNLSLSNAGMYKNIVNDGYSKNFEDQKCSLNLWFQVNFVLRGSQCPVHNCWRPEQQQIKAKSSEIKNQFL